MWKVVVPGGAALALAACVLLALPALGRVAVVYSAKLRLLRQQQPPMVAPDGEYYYVDESNWEFYAATGWSSVDAQWWVANDGSGRVEYSSEFGGPGVPASTGGPFTYSETFGAGGYDSVAYPSLSQTLGHHVPPTAFVGSMVPPGMSFDPETLPTDPGALSDALRSDIDKIASMERYGLYADPRWSESTKELMLIASALQDPMDHPELRSSLFTIAGELPGIDVQQGVADPLGRSGEAITSPEGPAGSTQEVFAVIFNPTTTQILAETEYPTGHPEQAKNAYTVFTGDADTTTDTTAPTTTTGVTTSTTTPGMTATPTTSVTTLTATTGVTTPTTTVDVATPGQAAASRCRRPEGAHGQRRRLVWRLEAARRTRRLAPDGLRTHPLA